jgi:hypothetical protein
MKRLDLRRFALVALVVALAGCQSIRTAQLGTHDQRLPAIRNAVSIYIEAGLGRDEKVLAAVCVPGSAVARQAMTDLPEIEGVRDLRLAEVRSDRRSALAITTPVKADHGRTGPLVFTLLQSAEGNWQIDDIDVEDADGLAQEIDRFMDRYPTAQILLQEDL